MRAINLNILMVVCVLIMTQTKQSTADTHYVSPGQSIQAAIDAANDDDEIEVAPGTYNEAINFNGKAVRLYSSGGAEVTTINGGGALHHVVQCVSGEGANTKLEGFTITGGNANGLDLNDRCGGGMYNSNSSPTVKNCAFSENIADGLGGGMFNSNSNPTVIGCLFDRNFTSDGSPGTGDGGDGGQGGSGAGMYNFNSSPTVTNCTFRENATGDGGNGAKGADGGFCEDGGDGGNGGKGGNGAGMYNNNSAPKLDFCTFAGNLTGGGGVYHCGGEGGYCIIDVTSDGACGAGGNGGNGAGMYNFNSSPTISSCKFTCNKTGNGVLGGIKNGSGDGGNGAGMCNHNSSPLVQDCGFENNITGNGEKQEQKPGHGGHGAGIFNGSQSSPTVRNCVFRGNVTGNGGNALSGKDTCAGANGGDGAGMHNYDDSSPTVIDCHFRANKTGRGGNGGNGYDYVNVLFTFGGGHGGDGGYGAGICNRNNSSPTITNSVFYYNITGNGGNGGRGGHKGFFGGGAGGGGGHGGKGAGIYNSNNASPSSINSCILYFNRTGNGGRAGEPGWGWWPGRWGLWGRGGLGGGIFVSFSSTVLSNCTFFANSALYGGGMGSELHSDSIVTNCTFKENEGLIGGGGIYNWVSNLTVTNCIFWYSGPTEDRRGDEISGSANVTYCDVKMPPSKTYPGEGNINVDPMFADDAGRLLAGSGCIETGSNSASNLPAEDFDGNPRITGTTVDMGAFEYTDFRIQNKTADNPVSQVSMNKNSGTSSETSDNLYLTIQAAIDDANDGDEISVLPGTYFESINFNGKAVRLYSTSGPEFTTISGTGHDHVVQCISGEYSNTILEGFTITGGNANGSLLDNSGGGMLNKDSSPTVINCKFANNTALRDGGGMYNYNSSPTLTDCEFADNRADFRGGGMYNENSSNPAVVNCVFEENTAAHYAGMLNNDNSNAAVSKCIFRSNEADNRGGAMANFQSNPNVTHCIFTGNRAVGEGGGMLNSAGSSPTVNNCNFRYNSAGDGGGMFNDNSNPIVTNCIFWGDEPNEITNANASSPTV
ncbi:MAG: right-handed parallel beta-helix repeat-containing protein, partial [Planctomycetota bacterium]